MSLEIPRGGLYYKNILTPAMQKSTDPPYSEILKQLGGKTCENYFSPLCFGHDSIGRRILASANAGFHGKVVAPLS